MYSFDTMLIHKNNDKHFRLNTIYTNIENIRRFK